MKARQTSYFNVGVQGRKTGVTLRENERDEHGIERVEGLFSSPAKPASPIKDRSPARNPPPRPLSPPRFTQQAKAPSTPGRNGGIQGPVRTASPTNARSSTRNPPPGFVSAEQSTQRAKTPSTPSRDEVAAIPKPSSATKDRNPARHNPQPGSSSSQRSARRPRTPSTPSRNGVVQSPPRQATTVATKRGEGRPPRPRTPPVIPPPRQQPEEEADEPTPKRAKPSLPEREPQLSKPQESAVEGTDLARLLPARTPSPMRRDLWRSPRPSASKLDANARTTSLRKEGESNGEGLFATPRRGMGPRRTLSVEGVVAATAKEPTATSTVAAMEVSPPWRPEGDDLDDAAPSNLKRKRERPTASVRGPSVERGGSADIAPRGVPTGHDQTRPGPGTTREPLQTIRETPVDESRAPLTTEQPRATAEEPSAHRRGGSTDDGRRGVPRGGHLDRAGTQAPPRAAREPLQRVQQNPVDQSGVLGSAVPQASQVTVTKPPAFLMYEPSGPKGTDRFRSEDPDNGRGSDQNNRESQTIQPPDHTKIAFRSAGTAIAHARAKAKAAAAAAKANKAKRGRGRPKGARNKPKSYLIPEDEKREPWEEDPGVVSGPVRLWDHEMEDSLDYLVEDEIAYSAVAMSALQVPTNNNSFKYAKTVALPFFAAGMVELPPLGVKRPKNSRRMQMVFCIVAGKVNVEISGTTFRMSRGGMFQVPRGNQYAISNDSTTAPARLFFAQGCELNDPGLTEDGQQGNGEVVVANGDRNYAAGELPPDGASVGDGYGSAYQEAGDDDDDEDGGEVGDPSSMHAHPGEEDAESEDEPPEGATYDTEETPTYSNFPGGPSDARNMRPSRRHRRPHRGDDDHHGDAATALEQQEQEQEQDDDDEDYDYDNGDQEPHEEQEEEDEDEEEDEEEEADRIREFSQPVRSSVGPESWRQFQPPPPLPLSTTSKVKRGRPSRDKPPFFQKWASTASPDTSLVHGPVDVGTSGVGNGGPGGVARRGGNGIGPGVGPGGVRDTARDTARAGVRGDSTRGKNTRRKHPPQAPSLAPPPPPPPPPQQQPQSPPPPSPTTTTTTTKPRKKPKSKTKTTTTQTNTRRRKKEMHADEHE